MSVWKRRNIFTVLVVVAAVVLIGGISKQSNPGARDQLQADIQTAGALLAGVELTDIQGAQTSPLDTASGDILVLNSWATWCPFCVHELPDFAAVQAMYPDDLVIVAVNRRESKSQVTTWLEENNFDTSALTYVFDEADRFYRNIGGIGMPETLIFDRDHNLVQHVRGPMDAARLQGIIEPLL